jgi:hypothetical protein
MASEDSKDILKNVDWKTVGGSVTTELSQPIVKNRLKISNSEALKPA